MKNLEKKSLINHDGDRKVVCLLCMSKSSKPLTEFQANKIGIVHQTNINFSYARVPRGLC